MRPLCTRPDCYDDAEFDSIRGDGKLCEKHALIEADDINKG